MEAAERQRFMGRVQFLLARVPQNDVEPLRRGGVKLFLGKPTLGGYYQPMSSSINLNVNVNGIELIHSVLHEVGHLVQFEVLGAERFKEYARISWFRLGPLCIRKFWCRNFFVTDYGSLSVQEDFAEGYAHSVFQLTRYTGDDAHREQVLQQDAEEIRRLGL